MKFLLTGDIHGDVQTYGAILAQTAQVDLPTIQIGDFGFGPAYKWLIDNLDPAKHKFLPGNHEAYDQLPPHALGDFGMYHNIFFVRGGYSIDWKRRTIGYDFFWNEELGRQQREDCLALYKEIKPDFVISHEAPRDIVHNFTTPGFLANWGYDEKTFTTNTSELLNSMFRYHQPKEWIFGHYHRSWNEIIDGTHFRLLNCYEPYILDV